MYDKPNQVSMINQIKIDEKDEKGKRNVVGVVWRLNLASLYIL